MSGLAVRHASTSHKCKLGGRDPARNQHRDRGGTEADSIVSRTQTTMSNPRLPPEILDYVIDLLHDEPEALKQCCLSSKLWVPRTRRHLFADIAFRSADDLVSWKKTFPDPANSPAYHARTVLVGCPGLITVSDAGEGGWIRTFSGIASLEVDNGEQYLGSLSPFYQFASTLKSLRVGPLLFPCPQLFALICSFPHLEDLSLRGVSPSHDDDSHGVRTIYSYPGTSPSLTGSLDLAILGGAGSVARLLLGLSSGLHFRKITFTWDRKEDRRWITELVASCSHTLESLDITYAFRRTFCSYLRLYQSNFVPSWAGTRPARPFESDQAPRRDFPTTVKERRMDRHGAPNPHARTSRSPTNLNLRASPLDHLQPWRRH